MTVDKIILKTKPHRISFVKEYVLAALLVVFLFYLNSIGFPINNFGNYAAFTMIILFVILPEFHRMRNRYIVTASQVIVEEGIISRKRKSVFMDNIADVGVHQNFFQRLLHFGTVTIGSSSGREHMELKLKGVFQPKLVAHEIEKLIKEYGKKEK